jgi:hypothetical protein
MGAGVDACCAVSPGAFSVSCGDAFDSDVSLL